jgi:anti-sigma regulatory factor (Ser/Thr protein kinase)
VIALETTVEVVEQSQVGQVRRLATELGGAQGLSETDLGRAALVATEMSTNLVKYGKKGTVTLERFAHEGGNGVQLIAADSGPGFDFLSSRRDGHSTGGTLGIGLGTIMRASDLFDTYSRVDQGTAVLSRICAARRVPPVRSPAGLELGWRRAAMRGQEECGDAWAHARSGRWERLCLVDGLGHGPLAAVASAAAVAAFHAAPESATPADIIGLCHAALNTTRGAVMAVAAIDLAEGRFFFAGVGNIMGVVHSGVESHHLLSIDGIVGHNVRKVRMVERSWTAGDTLVLCSDGLSGRWNMDSYPGLLQRHALMVASILFRDFSRLTDDATVLVAKDLR